MSDSDSENPSDELKLAQRIISIILKERGFGDQGKALLKGSLVNGVAINFIRSGTGMSVTIKRNLGWKRTSYSMSTSSMTMPESFSYRITGDTGFGGTSFYYNTFEDWKQALDYSLQLPEDLQIIERERGQQTNAILLEESKLTALDRKIEDVKKAQAALMKCSHSASSIGPVRKPRKQAPVKPYPVILPKEKRLTPKKRKGVPARRTKT
jgi:hypothetical protein